MFVRPVGLTGLWGRTFAHPQDLRAVRYAVGSTLTMAVAMGFQWELSFLVPVLSLSFLANPASRPNLRHGVMFVAVIGIASWAGLLLGRHLIPYPLLYLPFSALVLLHIFYAQQSGRSPLLVTWLLIAVLVVPILSMQSSALAALVAAGLVVGAAVTIVLIWLVYFFIPEPEDLDSSVVAATPAAKPLPPSMDRFKSAVLSTIVVFPVMVMFYMFEKTDSIVILIFIAILAQQPAFAKSFKAGKPLIIGNAIGGAAAIAVYELLVIMPEFGFLLLLVLLTGLVFGERVFSGKPAAPLYGMAFSTVLLIIGSVTSGTGDAGAKVYTRVFQIIIAVLYVVLAFGLIDRLGREYKEKRARSALKERRVV